ncbi:MULTISPECIES: hypothetical protein [Bacteroides]|nr:hypothetical protein [Bacteroides cellulosilyticus]
MANITLFAQAIGRLPKESIRKIIREGLDEPFTPLPELEGEE